MAGPSTNTKKAEAEKETSPTPVIVATEPTYHPVKLLRNYRPADDNFKILDNLSESEDDDPKWVERDPEGEHEILDERGKILVVADGDYAKVSKGTVIMLEKEAARKVLRNGVAQRHDDL